VGWVTLSKHENPTASFFMLANSMGCFLFLPFVFKHWEIYSTILSHIWIYAVVTGCLLALYFASLAKMLQSGDLSTSYPLLRALPVILVVVVSFILGTEEGISAQSICGILLVAAGCFLLPMRRFGDLRFENYINPASGFALLAALGIVGYSMLDDRALKILRSASSIGLSNFNLTVLYAFSQAVCLTIWLLLFILGKKERLRELSRSFQTRKRKAALTGVMIYLTYTLVLLSMASVKNVSYVVAFRQISIPLGAIAGILILGEKCYRPKFAGISVLLVGLILVSTG
jgi:uncharacterized membrane protein